MPDSNSLQSRQQVGGCRFTLIKPLGRGGMGEVWLAQDVRLNEPVALKFLPPEVRADPAALDDLRRETARSHRLTHPNIVRIHDLHEESGGLAFIAMEYVDGPTLAGLRLEQPGRVLSWEFLCPIVQQLCAALDYAHGERVIHRDLKPANVMVDGKGRLKLADFGIAATVSDSVSRVSGRQNTGGTLPYMSPQQLAGKHPQTADDIYALGATLYELLTSKPPFYTGYITHQVLRETPEPLLERLAALDINNEVPPDVGAIIMACLAKEPAQRPQSARAVAEWVGLEVVNKPSLQSLASEVFRQVESGQSVGPSEVGYATGPPPNLRRNLLLAGFAAALLALVVLGGWHWTTRLSARGRQPSRPPAVIPEPDFSRGPVQPTQPPVAATQDIPAPAVSTPAALEPGFASLFNGHDLSGWDGDSRFWSVEDDAIKGQTTAGNTPEHDNTYLIWTNGTVDDFELRFSYKLVDGETGSGVQYRGRRTTGWASQGYHADFFPATTRQWQSGLLYYAAPGRGPGALVPAGEKAVWGADGKKHVIGATPKSTAEIQRAIKEGDWNEYVITATGNHFVHQINGNITAEATDNDAQRRFLSGLLGLKLRPNGGNPMLVYFKDLRLKRLTQEADNLERDFRPLFNGRDLTGWKRRNPAGPNSWSILPGGILKNTYQKRIQGTDLLTEQKFWNFTVRFEFMTPEDANTGLFLRGQYEIQLLGDYKQRQTTPKSTGAIWSFRAPDRFVTKPAGEWQSAEFTIVGNRITIIINGVKIQDNVECTRPTGGGIEAQVNEPGPILLQGDWGTASFRNLRIRELPRS